MHNNSEIGVTLVELLVVIAVVAILASLVYPSYQNHILKTRYADGEAKILEIIQRQRRFFTSNNTYTISLIGDLEFADGGGGVSSEHNFYLITAVQCGDDNDEPLTDCVELIATPTFGGGGAPLTYNTRNEKGGPAKAW